MSSTVTIVGLIYDSPVTQFPVRTGPGTSFSKGDFTVAKGTSNVKILDIDADVNETQSDFGRVYNWFYLEFPDGKTAWMRDHVIGLQGDYSMWGFGKVSELKHAYLIPRDMSKAIAQAKQEKAEAATKPETEEAPSNPLAAAAQAAADVAKRVTQEVMEAVGLDDDDDEAMTKTAATGKPSGPPKAIIKVRSAANTRQGPSISNPRVFTIPRDAQCDILEVQRESTGQKLRWYKISHNGQQAWIREDLVQYTGNTEALGLPWDLYPAPLNIRWWVRDYNYDPDRDVNTWEHWGWDFGAAAGEPLYAGPFGGTVVKSFACSMCTPDRPSAKDHGKSLSDPGVLSSPEWGYGYGHYVIVGYKHDQLPASTQQAMANKGYGGGNVLVMYAHLQDRFVETGETLQPMQQFATVGNSGNSEAPHLHLEVRMTKPGGFGDWAAAKPGLTSPIILFNR